MNYIVTRHPGAHEWLMQQVETPAVMLTHLSDLSTLTRDDTVIGTLPINLVADLSARNVRYLHLEIVLPEGLRGQELSAKQLTELGAELVEYTAKRPVPDEVLLRMAEDWEDRL